MMQAAALPTGRILNWHRHGDPAFLGFGYAGGNASVLAPLAAHLPDGVGLAEMVMPGRAWRCREAPRTSVEQISAEALAQVRLWPRPPILFGYSLGALLAYETACRLQMAGMPPSALVVAALDAPHRLAPSRGVHRYNLPALRTHLVQMGATPPELLSDLAILACFAGAIQADYELLETYCQAAPRPALACPIVVLAGRADEHTSVASVHAWQELGSAGCQVVWVDAGHFFIQSHDAVWRRALGIAREPSDAVATTL